LRQVAAAEVGRSQDQGPRSAQEVSAGLRKLLADPARPEWDGTPDCYPGLLASHLAKHRRLAVRTTDETLLNRGDPREFAAAVGGSWERFSGGGEQLRTLLAGPDGAQRAGWSAYVLVRPPGGHAHMFELHADATVPVGEPGRLKWVDLQHSEGWREATPGLADGPPESLPLARVMLVDRAGNGVPLADVSTLADVSSGLSTADALLDPPLSTGPGMLQEAFAALRSGRRGDNTERRGKDTERRGETSGGPGENSGRRGADESATARDERRTGAAVRRTGTTSTVTANVSATATSAEASTSTDAPVGNRPDPATGREGPVRRPAERNDGPEQLRLYRERPELLYEVDGASDLHKLIDDLRASVEQQVRARVSPARARFTPGGRQAIQVDFSAIEAALRDDLQSFFTTGGRTFDVRVGWWGWQTVTISTTRLGRDQVWLDQGADKAKFDTRNDFSTALRDTATAGDSFAIGAGFAIGGRFGPGGGLSGEVALARAAEMSEASATLFDSHNLRSGGASHLLKAPVRFTVTVTVNRAEATPSTPPPFHDSAAHDGRAAAYPPPQPEVTATIGFRALDDIAKATPRAGGVVEGRFDHSTLVESLSPVRILDARVAADAGPTAPTRTWNEIAESMLRRFKPTGTVAPGTLGREQIRALLSEPSVLGQLTQALESDVHSPLILSPSRRQAVALQLNSEVTAMEVVADVKKSSFRWQPGYTVNGREQHISAVGGGGSAVPIRWGFGLAYVQLRLSAAFRRNTTTAARHTSTTRTGTEFKDIENVLAKVQFRLTINSATRVNAFQQPFRRGVRPVVLDLTVLSRLPRDKAEELLRTVQPGAASTAEQPAPAAATEQPRQGGPAARAEGPAPTQARPAPKSEGSAPGPSGSGATVASPTSTAKPADPITATAAANSTDHRNNANDGNRSLDKGKQRETAPERGAHHGPVPTPPRPAPPYARQGGHAMPYGMSQFDELQQQTSRLVRRSGGGFLPRFRIDGVARRMGFANSASERQRNQAELDRVLSVPALRQNYTTLLNGGMAAALTRTTLFHSRHVVIHVSARHPEDLVHTGVERNVAVRNFQSSGQQDSSAAGSQWRTGVAVEGAFIGRFAGNVNTGLSPGGAVEFQYRAGQQGGVDVTGQETALHGGTPSSQRYHGDLELVVTVYSYKVGLGRDGGGWLGLGRRATALRRVTDGNFTRVDQAIRVGRQSLPRYRLTATHPVNVLYADSAVPTVHTDHPVSVTNEESTPVARRTRTDLATLREFVDRPPTGSTAPERTISEWQFVESMPGSAEVLQLARQAVLDTQRYADRVSRRQLGGLRGDAGLRQGMPIWADLTDSLTAARQATSLGTMTERQWDMGTSTAEVDGGRLDVSIAARLTNPRIVPIQSEITTENAPGGGVQVWSSRTREKQLQARGQFGVSLRKPALPTDKYGGGGTVSGGYQRLLYNRSSRTRSKVSGFIERNVNNRKGKKRTYLVVADLRTTVAAEMTSAAQLPKSLVPRELQPDHWEHHKTVRRSAVIRNAVYLRVSEEQAAVLGLLGPPIGPLAAPQPRAFTQDVRAARLTLPPRRSPGLGLQTFRHVPSLVEPAIEALREAVNGPTPQPLARPILDALTGQGLADPMLNRRRMLRLLSRLGVMRNWAALFDGGVSLIHADAGVFDQRLYDVRLEATLEEEIKFDQFVANHDDIDVRTVGAKGKTSMVRTTRGGGFFANVAGSGVINPQGQPAAIGGGYQYNQANLTSNTNSTDSEQRTSDISSGRGVKARIVLRPRFQIRVYHDGTAVPGGTITFQAPVTVDRWAGDLRIGAANRDGLPPPRAYDPGAKPGPEPGWQVRNGLLIPPRFTPEDFNGAAHLQQAAQALLANAAKRVGTPGYVGAHQVHEGLTPELLLPNVGVALSPGGLDLPAVPSAQATMQEALLNLGLVPVAARLTSVDTAVYREHVKQDTHNIASGSNAVKQSLQTPRPLLGRGYLGDPYQAVENSNTGPTSGDTVVRASGAENSATSFGNVKPEGPSATIEYLCQPTEAVTLPRTLRADRVLTDDQVGHVTVVLRMGLGDARRVLGLHDGAPADVRADFDAIVGHERKLAKAAEEFVKAAEAEAAARYAAIGSQLTGAPMDEDLRSRWEEAVRKREQVEQPWWELLQEHLRRLDDFNARYVAMPDANAPANPTLPAIDEVPEEPEHRAPGPSTSTQPVVAPAPSTSVQPAVAPAASTQPVETPTISVQPAQGDPAPTGFTSATVAPAKLADGSAPITAPMPALPDVHRATVDRALAARPPEEQAWIRQLTDAIRQPYAGPLPVSTGPLLDVGYRATAALLGGADPYAAAAQVAEAQPASPGPAPGSTGKLPGDPEPKPEPAVVDGSVVPPGTDLDHEYGRLVPPKRVKPGESDSDGRVRLTPLWYRLPDFPRVFLERQDAHWHYAVDANGEIRIGSEEIRTVVEDGEWHQLLDGMRRVDENLTLDRLKKSLDGQGHPTIAAGFADQGITETWPARVSGEFNWNAASGRWEVNDKSGRYMSDKVRPDLEPDGITRWVGNVARRLSTRLGVEVTPVLLKHSEAPAPTAAPPVVPATDPPVVTTADPQIIATADSSASAEVPPSTGTRNIYLIADAIVRPYRTLPYQTADPRVERLRRIGLDALAGGADQVTAARQVAAAAELGLRTSNLPPIQEEPANG
jgi:hypothetical protein